jgi:hypothetical protein
MQERVGGRGEERLVAWVLCVKRRRRRRRRRIDIDQPVNLVKFYF